MRTLFRAFKTLTPILVLFLLCLSFGCQKQETAVADEYRAIAQRVVDEAWNQGKFDVLDEQFAADFVYHQSPQPDVVGLEAYKQFINGNRAAFPDLKLTITEIIIEGDKAVVRGTFTGTNTGDLTSWGIPATGKTVNFNWCTVSHRLNGKTIEQWNYVDFLGMMQQLGFTLAPPQPQETPEQEIE